MPVENENLPDIIMEDMDWVRVRGGGAQAVLSAERAERYEKTRIMVLQNYSFKQYDSSSGAIDSEGSGGKARIELESGNIKMTDAVIINVESENIKLDAADLEWRDKERFLSGGENTQVRIAQENGTDFSGGGFSADMRSRTWLFNSGVSGDYYLEDDDEETGTQEASTNPVETASKPGAAPKATDGETQSPPPASKEEPEAKTKKKPEPQGGYGQAAHFRTF